jgi:hypothetical protein
MKTHIQPDLERTIFTINENTPIYRFKFSDEFISILALFAKLHMHDDRKIFKNEWLLWSQENKDAIEKETTRLEKMFYRGNIQEKMFNSARYYFRKKELPQYQNVVIPCKEKKRASYISLNKKVLVAMDEYITLYNEKPSVGFDDFCEVYGELLECEIQNIQQNTELKDIASIQLKLKKTYKNRCFIAK